MTLIVLSYAMNTFVFVVIVLFQVYFFQNLFYLEFSCQFFV